MRMADRIDLRVGDLPWRPEGSELASVLHHYDMPLSGIISQHGTSYYFWCIRGEVTQGSLWGYAAIGDHEAHELENEPRDQALRRLSASPRPTTVAFSVEGKGIVKWGDLDCPPLQARSASESEQALLEMTPEESLLLEAV